MVEVWLILATAAGAVCAVVCCFYVVLAWCVFDHASSPPLDFFRAPSPPIPSECYAFYPSSGNPHVDLSGPGASFCEDPKAAAPEPVLLAPLGFQIRSAVHRCYQTLSCGGGPGRYGGHSPV